MTTEPTTPDQDVAWDLDALGGYRKLDRDLVLQHALLVRDPGQPSSSQTRDVASTAPESPIP